MVRTVLYFLSITFCLLINNLSASAQQEYEEMASFLQAGQTEANSFIHSYMTPLAKSFGYGLSTNWFQSGKTHEAGGFDLTFGMQMVYIPSADLSFNLSDINASNIQSTTNSSEVPTIVNGSLTNDLNIYLVEDIPLFSEDVTIHGFNIPDRLPLPSFNIGMGIVKNTEIRGRIIPSSSFGNYGNFNLWGLGIKHDIFQWLPINKFPIDGSFLISYSRLKMDFGFNYMPTADIISVVDLPADQKFNMKVSSLNFNLVLSKKIFFVTPFIAAGMTSNKYNLSLLGIYYIPVANPISGQTLIEDDDNYRLTDPVKINESFGWEPQVTAGIQLKYVAFSLHAAYTIQEYNSFSFGVGINVH